MKLVKLLTGTLWGLVLALLPELRLHYTTVGAPTGEPVLILHGTTGSGTGMLTSKGQPLAVPVK